MKKILFFIPTLTGRGAEKVLVNLVNNLDKSKYCITVLTLFNTGINRRFLSPEIKYKYIFKKIFRGNIHIFKIFKPETLFNYMIREEYDIIVSFLQGPTTRIVSGGYKKNAKLINWVHTDVKDISILSNSYRSVKELFECYNRYDYTVFVADSAMNSFRQIIPLSMEKCKVFYNVQDTDSILKLSMEKVTDINYKKNAINLISVGRFSKEKGYERLLKIVSRLVYEDKLNIHLYLIGEGKLEKSYRKIIKEKCIEKHVSLLGYKSNPYKYIKNSDLYVCSSYREGFSTSVAESLIIGTPVITTMCSGMKEMLGENGEYGYIVENNDEELYRGLKKLITNKKILNNLKVASKKRGKFFSKQRTLEEIESFFDSL